MSEEIIVDDINIYECTYSTKGVDGCWYCEEHLYDDGSPVCKCKENKDCYYKQLKRLQAENERLKIQLERKRELCTCQQCYDEGISDGIAVSKAEIEQLRAENEELKEENKKRFQECRGKL